MRFAQLGIPVAVVAVVVLMAVPLPPTVVDLLIAFNITLGLVVLLVSMQVKRPLDFAIFPTLLLVATMFRLALNVAVTRLVLLHGFAGLVVESFGHFVVGGSLIVGMVIFVILVVIQFVVITNGAGRVAEVGARFTLDAMPGKQMAIDADLNAGLIDEMTARQRRADVSGEADFYGAMDGASKFVKGDAIAAVVITMVNLIGGLAIGVLQRHMPVSEAIQTYSLLSIGDGLCSQIPALLISISTGIIITRSATEGDLGTDIMSQFGKQKDALRLAGGVIGFMGLVPGMPKLPFFAAAAGVFLLSSRATSSVARREAAQIDAETAQTALPAGPSPDSPEGIAKDLRVEPLELAVAIDLVELVDATQGGDLLDRVRALRRSLAMELGIVIPLVRTRDDLDLSPGSYVIRIGGVDVATGISPRGSVLAIGGPDGTDLNGLPGTLTREPVFGLPGKWVPEEMRRQAELTGATVVDRTSVVVTHLAEMVRRNAGRLLEREDVKALVDVVRQTHPNVVEEVTPALLTLGEVQRVLRGLLDEHVSIRDLPRIMESMSLRAKASTEAEGLIEAARSALGPAISGPYAANGKLPVISVDPITEQRLGEVLRHGEQGSFLSLDPADAEKLVREVARLAEAAEQRGYSPVLACSAPLRPAIRRLVRVASPRLPVLAYPELGTAVQLEDVGIVRLVERAGA
jgi:flagellar biosynthesis protein FlhA